MTVQELLDTCYAEVGYDPSPSASVVKRMTGYLDEAYRIILSMPEFASMRLNTLPFLSEANRQLYGWPQAFVQIDQVVNVTQNVRLRLMTQDQMRTLDPQSVASGTPTHYVPLGLGPTEANPPAARLWAVSDTPADTMTVSVFGTSARGFKFPRVTTALSGTTFVDVGGMVGQTGVDYVSVQAFQLTTPAAGFVYLYGALARPATPLVTNTGAGTYPAVLRSYKITFTTKAGLTVLRASVYSFVATFTPSGTGAGAAIARPPLPPETQTHWQVHASDDGVTFYQLSDLPTTTLTFTDTTLPSAYATFPVSPISLGTLLAVIPSGQLTAQYQRMRLWPTPSQADVYAVDGTLSLAETFAATDTPVIPIDFQSALVEYAKMKEYQYRSDDRYGMAKADYLDTIKLMRNRITNPPDYRPRAGRLYDRSNNLDHGGVNFPPGRW